MTVRNVSQNTFDHSYFKDRQNIFCTRALLLRLQGNIFLPVENTVLEAQSHNFLIMLSFANREDITQLLKYKSVVYQPRICDWMPFLSFEANLLNI